MTGGSAAIVTTCVFLILVTLSFLEDDAGKTHTLVAARMDMLVVMNDPPAARPNGLQKSVRRWQSANASSISLVGDHSKVTGRIDRLRLSQDCQILPTAVTQERWRHRF